LPTQKQKQYTISIIAGLVVNIISNLILIPINGAFGAAIATTISQAVVVWVQVHYVRKQINVNYAFKTAKKYLIVSIVMFLVCSLVGVGIQNGIISVIAKIIAGGITYLIMLIILKDKYVYEILDLVKAKLKRG